jgi:hypothetical protein
VIEQIEDCVRAYSRGRKESLGADASHFLVIVRESRIIAVIACDEVGDILRVAHTAAAGYGADALALVLEGVFPTVPENPMTGHPWQQGEAQRAWRDHNGVAEGWVTEAAITTVATRGGLSSTECQPFRLENGAIVWAAQPMDFTATGLAELLLERLSGPTVDSARMPDPGEGFIADPQAERFYDAEFGRIALDIGCTRVLGTQLGADGEALLVLESEQQAEFYISEGLPRWQVEVAAMPSLS